MICIKYSSAYRLTFFAMRCEFILAFHIDYTTSSLNFNIAKCSYLTYCTWMCKNKQASEPSLGAEVDDQSPLAIYAHAGRVQGTYKNSQWQPSSPSCECGWNIFFLIFWKTILSPHLVDQPLAGYRCRPSIRWQCRTQMWAWALTVSRSAAILPLPRGSGTRRRREVGRVGSHRTGSDSTPAVQIMR